MRLAVGDAVVYPAYGVGRVAAREPRALSGVEQEVVVLELGHGLVVTLSIAEARARLRPVASGADLRRVQKTLRADSQASDGSWAARVKEGQAKQGREILAGEISSARGLEQVDADAWIQEQLTPA